MKRKIFVYVVMFVMGLGINLVSVYGEENISESVTGTAETPLSSNEDDEWVSYPDPETMPKEYRYTAPGTYHYYDLEFCSNITIKNQAFKGKASTPVPTILVHNAKTSKVDTPLKSNYYTIEYKNNDKPGKATAIIKGKNGFFGEVEVTFKIKMPKVKIKYVNATKDKKLRVKVKNLKIKGMKYQVRYKKNTGKTTEKSRYSETTGKWKTLKANKSTKIKSKRVKRGNYFVQVRSYIKVGNKKYYGDWVAYDALVNVKTKKANKKNFTFDGYRSPNKFNAYYKNAVGINYRYDYYNSTKINGINYCNWIVTDFNGKGLFVVTADKYGNIIEDFCK